MDQAERASIVARTAFAKEWEGLAHTTRVVARLPLGASDELRAVAWLHDVVEDTDVDFVDLYDMGFSEVVVEAVRLLTRECGFDYGSYKGDLMRARGEVGRLARAAKLADALDNLARCALAAGVPKWERLAKTRYAPLVEQLELLAALEEIERTAPPSP